MTGLLGTGPRAMPLRAAPGEKLGAAACAAGTKRNRCCRHPLHALRGHLPAWPEPGQREVRGDPIGPPSMDCGAAPLGMAGLDHDDPQAQQGEHTVAKAT
jgi:hypothetical protein